MQLEYERIRYGEDGAEQVKATISNHFNLKISKYIGAILKLIMDPQLMIESKSIKSLIDYF